MTSLIVALLLPITPAKASITVLAAASLRGPVNEIIRKFEAQNADVRIEVTYAGSQALANQINFGAPADIFLAADLAQMNIVVQSGKVDGKAVKPFASNQLALLISKSAANRVKDLKDLSKDGLRLCMANEKVPVGAYTRQMLQKASKKLGAEWLSKVRSNTVSLENNVSAVVTRISMDEADAGFVYQTDVLTAKQAVSVPIPKAWNVMARYYLAVPKEAPNAKIANKIVSLVLAKDGQTILAKYGFLSPR